jgi:glycosyltransferase involved in cell wall biosynthesis
MTDKGSQVTESVNTEKPLITFALFAYNQERYIREAIEGAFAQTYSPLEVILSDDCSTDGTYQVIQDAATNYNGPHRVVLNRTSRNCGLAEHINQVGKLCKGKFIVLAAGDDISLPERSAKLVEHWFSVDCAPVCIYSDFSGIDTNGLCIVHPPCHLDFSSKTLGDYVCRPFALMASYGFANEVLTSFGPLSRDVLNEDFVFACRSLLLAGRIEYISKPLIEYRIGVGISSVPSRDRTRRGRFLKQNLTDFDTVGINNHCRKRLTDQIENEELLGTVSESPGLHHFLWYLWTSSRLEIEFSYRLRCALEICYPKVIIFLRSIKQMLQKNEP